jgi:hypothetical protein
MWQFSEKHAKKCVEIVSQCVQQGKVNLILEIHLWSDTWQFEPKFKDYIFA